MRHRFVIGPEQVPERIDRVLGRLLAGTSRATVQRWIAEGRVRVDGRECRPRDPVSAGAVVEVEEGPPPLSKAEPDASVPFTVLFEDAHLIVVDKPAGVVVHPGRGHRSGTLVSGLLARPGFEHVPHDPRDPEGSLRPGIVHRLDKNTSGVMVVAKSAVAREGLKSQLGERRVERMYRAITLRVPRLRTISTLYGRHRTQRLRFTSRTDSGKRAITHVTIEEKLAESRAALVSCRLETGRTHQIRVHLSEQAHAPVFADALYGGTPSDPALREVAEALGRQALHAEVLGFEHPVSGETQRFSAPIPVDMQHALESLRRLKA